MLRYTVELALIKRDGPRAEMIGNAKVADIRGLDAFDEYARMFFDLVIENVGELVEQARESTNDFFGGDQDEGGGV